MGETISAWIRATGINPILLGWLVSLAILALIDRWRRK
jgi:hypothetical protein